MRRRIFSLLATVGLLALSATPAFAADGDRTGTIMIMKHACTEADVRNQADFDALQTPAKGDEVTALALTVLACPTIVLADDEGERTNGVAGPAVDFDFEVTDSEGNTQTIADAEFMAAKLCESDIKRDANGDGNDKDPNVCLDISHYVFNNVAVGEVTVEETSPPNGWKFGSLLLTPKALQPEGNDQATNATFDAESATVELDLSGDDDNQAMLHIYNFEASPATDTVPAAAASGTTAALALGLGAFSISILGTILVFRRRTN